LLVHREIERMRKELLILLGLLVVIALTLKAQHSRVPVGVIATPTPAGVQYNVNGVALGDPGARVQELWGRPDLSNVSVWNYIEPSRTVGFGADGNVTYLFGDSLGSGESVLLRSGSTPQQVLGALGEPESREGDKAKAPREHWLYPAAGLRVTLYPCPGEKVGQFSLESTDRDPPD
jgi:hypothetical protein